MAFDCDNEDELLMELDAMIEDMFGGLVAKDDECDCEHCSCKE